MKLDSHIRKKLYVESKRGPGVYESLQLMPKKNVKFEYQFFGSSVERGDETQLKKTKANDSKIGPGTYPVPESFQKEN